MSSTMLSYAGVEDTHFLEACTLCSKSLGHNSDIYMYRGNTPFCSQECRQEQIEIDEAREKRWRVSKKSKESTKKSATTRGEHLYPNPDPVPVPYRYRTEPVPYRFKWSGIWYSL